MMVFDQDLLSHLLKRERQRLLDALCIHSGTFGARQQIQTFRGWNRKFYIPEKWSISAKATGKKEDVSLTPPEDKAMSEDIVDRLERTVHPVAGDRALLIEAAVEILELRSKLNRCKNVMECNDPGNYEMIFGGSDE